MDKEFNKIYTSLKDTYRLDNFDYDKIDYKALGFRCGVEIHQQLNTHKLFCNCKSLSHNYTNNEKNRLLKELKESFNDENINANNHENIKNYDDIKNNKDQKKSTKKNNELDNDKSDNKFKFIKRYLSTSESELGLIDLAANYESKKNKCFYYNTDDVCLVEVDEEPPHEINKEALLITLQITKLLNAKKVDLLNFMRKIVIDGSNTSGFQRTGLIATDGFIKIDDKIVKINTICLEEDASQIIERTNQYDFYSLERLGTPLVEIATDPDIEDPNLLRKSVEKIGLILRSVNVKRGLGTIRQDINISIKYGNRVEIKGAQDLKLLNKVAKREAIRQLRFLQVKEQLINKKFFMQYYLNKINNGSIKDNLIINIKSVFKKTKSKMILNNKSNDIYGLLLPHLKGLLGYEILPGIRLGKELYNYTKDVTNLNGIIHADELPNYGISSEEVNEIYKILGSNEKNEDGFIFVISDYKTAKVCFSLIIKRLNEIMINGVPSEVRKVLKDGNTVFLRPMPGSERMYPETDVPPFDLTLINVEKPITLFDKIKKLNELGINNDLAKIIVKKKKENFILELIKDYKNLKPSYILTIIFSKINELKREYPDINENNISNDFIKELLKYLNDGLISKQSVNEILLKKARGNDINLEDYKLIDTKKIKEKIKELIEKDKNLPKGAIIGKIMQQFNGRVNGKELSKLIDEIVNNNIL